MTSTALRPTGPFAMYPKNANAIPTPINLDTSDDFENSSVSNLDNTPNKKRTRTYEQQRLKNHKSNARKKEKKKSRLEQVEQVEQPVLAEQPVKVAQVEQA